MNAWIDQDIWYISHVIALKNILVCVGRMKRMPPNRQKLHKLTILLSWATSKNLDLFWLEIHVYHKKKEPQKKENDDCKRMKLSEVFTCWYMMLAARPHDGHSPKRERVEVTTSLEELHGGMVQYPCEKGISSSAGLRCCLENKRVESDKGADIWLRLNGCLQMPGDYFTLPSLILQMSRSN